MCSSDLISKAIVSSVVLGVDHLVDQLNNSFDNCVKLTYKTRVPFTLEYKSPASLGNDRIALAAYGAEHFKGSNMLLIDAGSCVTFEFVNHKNQYLGGAISPGLMMRFKSLNQYTSKLPLVSSSEFYELTGQTTEESIWVGVQRGIINEIDGAITDYQNKYQDLKVLITGGDHNFLHRRLKSNTFAHPNAVILGLDRILEFNA